MERWFYQQAFDPAPVRGEPRKMSHEVHDAHGEPICVCKTEREARFIANALNEYDQAGDAPDLLEALKLIAAHPGPHADESAWYRVDVARAAMAKAAGAA